MTNTDVQVEIRFGDLELLMAKAPFDQAKTAIEKEGGTIAPAQQIAQARIVAGPDHHHVSNWGSWTAENFIYFPNGKF
ncbi:hypothetical protein GF374_00110 [Candidatus Woesearchaeota archaeon]|nr:hypothetical protein [Candidatus Woesearchaeota archaeon]